MATGPIRSAHLLWLLLGSLIPLLFVLDFLVGESGRRQVYMDVDLRVHKDGARPMALSGPLQGEAAINGLQVSGSVPLTEGRYPWRPLAKEASFLLRLDSAFLRDGAPGVRETGFVASYQERDLKRADGLSTPLVPCSGRVTVRTLEILPKARGLSAIQAAELEIDLICTSTGPDLLWKSGDERVWTIEGPLELKVGAPAL